MTLDFEIKKKDGQIFRGKIDLSRTEMCIAKRTKLADKTLAEGRYSIKTEDGGSRDLDFFAREIILGGLSPEQEAFLKVFNIEAKRIENGFVRLKFRANDPWLVVLGDTGSDSEAAPLPVDKILVVRLQKAKGFVPKGLLFQVSGRRLKIIFQNRKRIGSPGDPTLALEADIFGYATVKDIKNGGYGIVKDSPTGIMVKNSGCDIRWVIVNRDESKALPWKWVIKYHFADKDWEYIEKYGATVQDIETIRRLTGCGEEPLEYYDYDLTKT